MFHIHFHRFIGVSIFIVMTVVNHPNAIKLYLNGNFEKRQPNKIIHELKS